LGIEGDTSGLSLANIRAFFLGHGFDAGGRKLIREKNAICRKKQKNSTLSFQSYYNQSENSNKSSIGFLTSLWARLAVGHF